MRARLSAAAVLVALLATAPAAAAQQSCPAHGARVIARNKRVAVYSTRATRRRGEPQACLLGGGSHVGLSLRAIGRRSRGRATKVVLAGTLVAFDVRTVAVDTSHESLAVVDVAGGTPLGGFINIGGTSILQSRRITQFVLSRSGSLAWVVEETGPKGLRQPPPPVFRVQLAAVGEPVRTLDEGTAIGAGSLTLSRGRLHWHNGATPGSAAMP